MFACAHNPATGERTGRLMSEDEELALGKVSDQDILDNLRVLDDSQPLSVLVAAVGQEVAAQTERPDLPWTFRVLDDPAVNAFAVPGGYVYVTRGLLTHLNAKDELAAVLGHECGHIAARHGVIAMRAAQKKANAVAFLAGALDPNRSHVAAVAARSARLKLLESDRAQELEADELMLRYVAKTDHEPAAFLEVLGLLAQLDVESERVPSWLSTHPAPEQRQEHLAAKLGDVERAPAVDSEYLAAIDGVVHGPDPREGLLVDSTYVHGRVGFAFDLPAGWALEGDRESVTALAPDNLSQMGVAPKYYAYDTAEKATTAFFISGIYLQGTTTEVDAVGTKMLLTNFVLPTRMGDWVGLVGFVALGDSVVAVMASAPKVIWPQHEQAVTAAFSSLRLLTPEQRLVLEPARIEIAELPPETSLRAFAGEEGAGRLDALARLNRLDPEQTSAQARAIKTIRFPTPPEPVEPASPPPPASQRKGRKTGKGPKTVDPLG